VRRAEGGDPKWGKESDGKMTGRVYFGFGKRFRLMALHAQRSDSGRCRGVT
jgi:hypothetical protein